MLNFIYKYAVCDTNMLHCSSDYDSKPYAGNELPDIPMDFPRIVRGIRFIGILSSPLGSVADDKSQSTRFKPAEL